MADYFKRPIRSDRMSESYGHTRLHDHTTRGGYWLEFALATAVVSFALWAIIL